MSFIYNANVSPIFPDGTNSQVDNQGRLRVSVPQQNWWFVPSVDNSTDLRFSSNITGNGAATTFIQNLAATELAGGTDANSACYHVSRRRHKILPSVPHLWDGMLNWDGADPSGNTTKRAGMFTNYNGMYWYVNSDIGVGIRRRILDGTVSETLIPRSSFNVDKLDGTGPSGYNWTTTTVQNVATYVSTANVGIVVQGGTQANTNVYNVTYTTSNNLVGVYTVGQKVLVQGITPNTYNGIAQVQSLYSNGQITLTYTKNPGTYSSGAATANLTYTHLMDGHAFFIDFGGSRAAKIRFGFLGNTGPIVCHLYDYTNTNLGSLTFDAPSLPTRKEIVKTGAMSSFNPTMTLHGATFNTELQIIENPGFNTVNSNSSGMTFSAVGQSYPILGLALRYGEPYQRGDIQLNEINIIDTANDGHNATPAAYLWQVILNPTIGGTVPSPTNVGKASQVWMYTTATTWSGGTPLIGGLIGAEGSVDVTSALNFLNLGSNWNNTSADQVVLVITELVAGGSSGNLFAQINFTENQIGRAHV